MKYIALPLLTALLAACSQSEPNNTSSAGSTDQHGFSAATESTRQKNNAVIGELPFTDQTDFEQANRGLIAAPASNQSVSSTGEIIWNMDEYQFVQGEAPASVNPSLWRQAKLNNINGLYEVKPGIYQLRGFDLANMTLIKGDTGWILVDPLTAAETAKTAMAFAREHLGNETISAVIFTHSHIDHFGGFDGLGLEGKDIPIYAPEGFIEEATSENVIAGTAMSRRSMFMYGKRLPRSERGHIGSGLGKGPAFGTFGIAEPTHIINHDNTEQVIDGVKFEFHYVPESEAPAEIVFYLPEMKAFCGAELVSRNMHNLYTLRGAKVRDALKWSAYIDQVREAVIEADTYFASHHWPMWGQQEIQTFLSQQRDTYKFIHDQTVRLMNQGLNADEIADRIALPESLDNSFHNRGYYGTTKHNSRAVFQGYLGWYDGNPANLDPLPTTEAAQRTMKMMGGIDQVVAQAQLSFDQASDDPYAYRWVAQLLNKAVIAEPGHKAATALLARTYDQLGYQAESGPWRDVYLSAAYELRHGAPETGIDLKKMRGLLLATPPERFFETMAVRLNGDKAAGEKAQIKVHFTDRNESFLLSLDNSVLQHKKVSADAQADATLNISHTLFIDVVIGRAGIKEVVFSDDLEVDGSRLDLLNFLRLFDQPKGAFPIVNRPD